MQPAVSRILIHTHLHSRKDFMANYTPKKVHPHKISLVFLCKSPLVWILGVANTPPKSIPPWKIRKPPPTSKDMPRCIAAITVMEAPPLEPRLVGVVEGMKFPMNGRMECRLALHVNSYIYIYTSFTQYEI